MEAVKTWEELGIATKGRTTGDVRCPCPQCSSSRKKRNYPCLHADLDKGVWLCHHCGWTGSVRTGEWARPQVSKRYTRPDYVSNSTGLPAHVLAWFEDRGIPESVLRRNQIGYGLAYMPQLEEEVGTIQFPYFRGTEIVNVKYRDGRKNFRMHGGAERILYGLNDIAETTLVVEGEMDKLACEVAGFPNCVSVPDGAPAPDSRSYESKFNFLDAPQLEAVKSFVLAVDSDAPGRRLQDELVRRLGPEKCLIVTWPEDCKDANDVLRLYGPVQLRECLEAAAALPIVGAFEVESFSEKLDSYYREGEPRGVACEWKNISALYTVRPGELTVVTGIPGSGKSEWLDALTMSLARSKGWSFAMFSPENQPIASHVAKLAEKYIGKPFNPGPHERMNATEFDLARTWLNDHYAFILPESPTLESILVVCRQLVLRRGVRGLVIDPWNEVEHARPESQTETEYVSQCLSKIKAFARSNDIHVWVAAHPTKLQKQANGKYPVPTPYDISGGANWRNKADNAITIWRDNTDDSSRNVEIHVTKIRHKIVGRIGTETLLYDRNNGRYYEPVVMSQRDWTET